MLTHINFLFYTSTSGVLCVDDTCSNNIAVMITNFTLLLSKTSLKEDTSNKYIVHVIDDRDAKQHHTIVNCKNFLILSHIYVIDS